MDNLRYYYGNDNNRLNLLRDSTVSVYTTDIQDSINYIYNSIGNLTSEAIVSDTVINEITWNYQNKVKTIGKKRYGSHDTIPFSLEYRYDASGNRICKIIKN